MDIRNIKHIWLFPFITFIFALLTYFILWNYLFKFYTLSTALFYWIFGALIYPIFWIYLGLLSFKVYKHKIPWKKASLGCIIFGVVMLSKIFYSLGEYIYILNSKIPSWGGPLVVYFNPSLIQNFFLILTISSSFTSSFFLRISRLPIKEKMMKERYCKNCQKHVIPIKKFNITTFLMILFFLPFLFGIPALLYIIFYRYIPKCPDCLKNKFAYSKEEIQLLEGSSISNEPSNARYCTECGMHLAEDQSFCGVCGNKI